MKNIEKKVSQLFFSQILFKLVEHSFFEKFLGIFEKFSPKNVHFALILFFGSFHEYPFHFLVSQKLHFPIFYMRRISDNYLFICYCITLSHNDAKVNFSSLKKTFIFLKQQKSDQNSDEKKNCNPAKNALISQKISLKKNDCILVICKSYRNVQ